MKYSYLLLLLLCLGCQNFETKKISSDEIIQEELKEFNWQEVEVYPSFKECESFTETQEKKTCFEKPGLKKTRIFWKTCFSEAIFSIIGF